MFISVCCAGNDYEILLGLFLRFVSTWIGQSEELIHELFDHALAYNVALIIFVNEIDKLCRTRQIIEDDNVGRVSS
ncbi:ATPase associated with various cellular activities (AAA) family protein [Brugia pahangi]